MSENNFLTQRVKRLETQLAQASDDATRTRLQHMLQMVQQRKGGSMPPSNPPLFEKLAPRHTQDKPLFNFEPGSTMEQRLEIMRKRLTEGELDQSQRDRVEMRIKMLEQRIQRANQPPPPPIDPAVIRQREIDGLEQRIKLVTERMASKRGHAAPFEPPAFSITEDGQPQQFMQSRLARMQQRLAELKRIA